MTRRLPDAIAQRLNAAKKAEEAPGRYRNVGKMLTRLQPRSPSIVPRKGSSAFRELWEIEDGPTIAGAIGAVAARGPGPALAVAFLCVRWWPDYVFGPEVVRIRTEMKEAPVTLRARKENGESVYVPPKKGKRSKGPKLHRVGSRLGTTHALAEVPLRVGYGKQERTLKHEVDGKKETVKVYRAVEKVTRHLTFRPAVKPILAYANHALERELRWDAMPPKVQEKVRKALADDRLALTLLQEFTQPNACPTCAGHGLVYEPRQAAHGQPAPSPFIDCPACIGSCHQPWGVTRRAKAAGMRAEDFHRHVARGYNAVLGLMRRLEGRAARSVIRFLGD